MNCSKCGGLIGASDPSCPHCGAPLEVAKKEGKSSGRKGMELLFAAIAALALVGVIVACSYFLPIMFNGLPTIDATFYTKDPGELYIYSDLHSSPQLVTTALCEDTGVFTSNNGRFFAYVEHTEGVETLYYVTVDEKGDLHKQEIDTDASNITITNKGDKVYYLKEGFLYRFENNMSTKLYQAPVDWYRLSDTQSVVLFGCDSAEGEGSDLYLLDFAQNDVRVTAVDSNAVRVDTSLQTKRFAKITYAKVEEDGDYTVWMYENGEARKLAENVSDYCVGADGTLLALRDKGSALTYARFITDDLAAVDNADMESPDAQRRNLLREELRTTADLPLFDAYYITSEDETLVAEGVFSIDQFNRDEGMYILDVSHALRERTVNLSEIDNCNPIGTLIDLAIADGNDKILFSATEEVAVLATSEINKFADIYTTDWKSFYRHTTDGFSGIGTLEVIADPANGSFKLVDNDVATVAVHIGYQQLLYVRGSGDLYAYDGTFSSILAADVRVSSLEAQEEGAALVCIENVDGTNLGSLVLLQNGKKIVLGNQVSDYEYNNGHCVYYTVPTIGDRSDLYVSNDKGESKLVDRDILTVY